MPIEPKQAEPLDKLNLVHTTTTENVLSIVSARHRKRQFGFCLGEFDRVVCLSLLRREHFCPSMGVVCETRQMARVVCVGDADCDRSSFLAFALFPTKKEQLQ